MYKVVIVKISDELYWYNSLKGRVFHVYETLINDKYICVENSFCINNNDIQIIEKVS